MAREASRDNLQATDGIEAKDLEERVQTLDVMRDDRAGR
jgi:hypothetical protein